MYYIITILTRPGAKGCYNCHSTRQHAGFSVLPMSTLYMLNKIYKFSIQQKGLKDTKDE